MPYDIAGALNTQTIANTAQNIDAAAERGIILGEARESRKSKLAQYQLDREVTQARKALYTMEPGSPEHKQAQGTLMALDREGLQKDFDYLEGQKKAVRDQETHDQDIAKGKSDQIDAGNKRLGELAHTVYNHSQAVRAKTGDAERIAYVESIKEDLVGRSPELGPALEQIIADGKITDEELDKLDADMKGLIDETGVKVVGEDGSVSMVGNKTGTVTETDAVQRASAGTNVSVNTAEDPNADYIKQLAKKGGEEAAAFMERASTAAESNSLVSSFEAALDQDVETGKLQKTLLPLKAVLEDLGFAFNADLPIQQAIESLTTDLALTKTAKTKGAISDREMNMFVSAVPNLSLTPEGNKLIARFMREKNDHDIRLGQMAAATKNPEQLAALLDTEFAISEELMQEMAQVASRETRTATQMTDDDLAGASDEELDAILANSGITID